MWVLDFETASYPGLCEDRGERLAYEATLQTKYRHWRGHSGRSYVFSVYAPDACPAYEDAVVLVAERGKTLACVDLGALPVAELEGLRRRFAHRATDFHIHVLADRSADRRALIADLTPDAGAPPRPARSAGR